VVVSFKGRIFWNITVFIPMFFDQLFLSPPDHFSTDLGASVGEFA